MATIAEGGKGDTKPAESKPAEQKPAESKPAEQKPAEQKPAEEKPGEQKPAESKPAEQKPAEQKPAESKPADDGKKPESKAPDKYELKLPDGAKEWLDKSDLTQIEALARSKNWTNDQAQTALEEHADALAGQSAAFRSQTEADPTYGGDKLEETQRLARAALDKLRPAGTPRGDAFRKLLTKSGYGNNLEVVSMLADLGRLMAEDSPGAGGSGGGGKGGKKSPEQVLYGATTAK